MDEESIGAYTEAAYDAGKSIVLKERKIGDYIYSSYSAVQLEEIIKSEKKFKSAYVKAQNVIDIVTEHLEDIISNEYVTMDNINEMIKAAELNVAVERDATVVVQFDMRLKGKLADDVEQVLDALSIDFAFDNSITNVEITKASWDND